MGVTKRNIAAAIILSIVTCGIYGLYWLVCLADDVNKATGTTDGTSGGMVLVLSIITCGIYGLYWAYKTGEKIDDLRVQRGLSSGSRGLVFLLLNFFGLSIITFALIQSELNDFADAQNV